MGLLMILATIGGLILALILLIIAFCKKLDWLRNFVFGATAIWLAIYAVTLLTVSLMSQEKTLSFNEPKEFCGFYLDCHLHAAVTNLRIRKMLGDKIADGEFYIVTVKVSNDARRATLGLLTVEAKVVDDANQEFARDVDAEEYLGEQPPFETEVPPSENFERKIVFDLPETAQNPRLDIREGYGIDHLIEAVLIGDEDSIWHNRNYFTLAQQKQNVRVN